MVTSVHEIGHTIQLMLAGSVPDWVNCIRDGNQNGSVSARCYLVADVGQDFSMFWKYRVKLYYSGMIGAAYYCGAYEYGRAGVDLAQVEELTNLYNLTEGDLLDCWMEAHQDITEHWPLIWEMALELKEKQILGCEYFEEILLTR